jgi:hypothetical protein
MYYRLEEKQMYTENPSVSGICTFAPKSWQLVILYYNNRSSAVRLHHKIRSSQMRLYNLHNIMPYSNYPPLTSFSFSFTFPVSSGSPSQKEGKNRIGNIAIDSTWNHSLRSQAANFAFSSSVLLSSSSESLSFCVLIHRL